MVLHAYEITPIEVEGVRVDGVLEVGPHAIVGTCQFLFVTRTPTTAPSDAIYWIAPSIGPAGVVAIAAPESWRDLIQRQFY